MAAENSCVMTEEGLAAYIQHEQDRGASPKFLSSARRITGSLYRWLPEDKLLTKERLSAWRKNLEDRGLSPHTCGDYAKGINRCLDYLGWGHLRFNQGKAKNIAGQTFGYLTVLEPTGEKYRRDLVWQCRCQCGRELCYPATRLLTGNTLSCGCLKTRHMQRANKYIDGTSLRQSLAEQVLSPRAASGYTGVTRRGDKWKAYIRYKGKTVSLGCYADLEDAVKARARGKELVQQDAQGLLDFYQALHRDDPQLPRRQTNQRESD